MYVYCVFQCTDSSDGESGAEEEGGGGGGDNPLSGLRAKMKELSTSHDLVTKNRCVCVCACIYVQYCFSFKYMIVYRCTCTVMWL